MRSSSTHRVATLLAVAVLASCDGPPTRPAPGGSGPPPAPGASLVRFEISAPTSVAPGQSVQFTATGHYDDGSTKDLSADSGTSWGTSNPAVLAISPSGVAVGRERGEAVVTAVTAGRRAVTSVLVLPAGTYRLAGSVIDNGVPVVGARVEVTRGSGAGLFAVTDRQFALYGLSGLTEILVTKEGYFERRWSIDVEHHISTDFEITPRSTNGNVEGVYELTVTPASKCTTLPTPEFNVFTAVIKQEGRRVTATLEGPGFLTSGSRTYNTFKGTLANDQLLFSIDWWDPWEGYLWEWPGVSRYFAPSLLFFMGGLVTTTLSAHGSAGTLSGTVGVGEYNDLNIIVVASCLSDAHRFELVRR